MVAIIIHNSYDFYIWLVLVIILFIPMLNLEYQFYIRKGMILRLYELFSK